jgi:L-asparaginase
MFGEISTIHKVKNTEKSVLVIYTGGTLGMVYDLKQKALVPFKFDKILETLPEIERFTFNIGFVSLEKPIDSSNVSPQHWTVLIDLIALNYNNHDGFVVLHGTDTMAYTASALSFGLQNLGKPIIFTGAQLPIGVARTDARENFMTALEIASLSTDSQPIVPEVAIYFNGKLLRGNRSKKKESSLFNAFKSENYPSLADIGVNFDFNYPYIKPYQSETYLNVFNKFDDSVFLLNFFPGLQVKFIEAVFEIPNLKAVVIESFGSGNLPSNESLISILKKATDAGIIILNISQCDGGKVNQGLYQTSTLLEKAGVIGGADLTSEAAVTKLMHLLAYCTDNEEIKSRLKTDIAGEIS